MSQEHFKSTRVWDADARQHRSYKSAVCRECGELENVPINGIRPLPPEAMVKLLQKHGWAIGQRRKDDLCPACVKKKVSEKKVTNIADHKKPVAAVVPAPAAAPAPAAPAPVPLASRENKRLVILALEERYLDAQRGYDTGWSDERIAKDLDVPRKLVADIREEFYGPEIDAEAARLRGEVAEIEGKLATLQTVLSDLRAKHNDVKERLSKKGLL